MVALINTLLLVFYLNADPSATNTCENILSHHWQVRAPDFSERREESLSIGKQLWAATEGFNALSRARIRAEGKDPTVREFLTQILERREQLYKDVITIYLNIAHDHFLKDALEKRLSAFELKSSDYILVDRYMKKYGSLRLSEEQIGNNFDGVAHLLGIYIYGAIGELLVYSLMMPAEGSTIIGDMEVDMREKTLFNDWTWSEIKFSLGHLAPHHYRGKKILKQAKKVQQVIQEMAKSGYRHVHRIYLVGADISPALVQELSRLGTQVIVINPEKVFANP